MEEKRFGSTLPRLSPIIRWDLLAQIGELEKASFHSRQALCHARGYKFLEAKSIRNLLVHALIRLFDIHTKSGKSGGGLSFLPTMEELVASEGEKEMPDNQAQLKLVEMNLIPGKLESFYPLAEMYMGDRRKELPHKVQALDKLLRPRSVVKQKKKKSKR